MFNNKCMSVLAWWLTCLYQGNKNSKPDTCCPPVRELSVLSKDEGKIMMNLICKSGFLKAKTDYCLSVLPFTANSLLALFLPSEFYSYCLIRSGKTFIFICKRPLMNEHFLSFPAKE
jgi:hypothetical protein